MTPASRAPLHDAARLEEIADLGLLSTDVDPILQEIATRAATELALPMAVVSVVLDDAQHVAAAHGIDDQWLGETRGLPVEWSFCANSVRTRDAFVVENALVHPDVSANPLVTHDGIRCYAGIPLITSRGFVLGNLCVIGREERTFTERELETLRALARETVERIEARRPQQRES